MWRTIIVVVASLSAAAPALAEQSADRLNAALSVMHNWVGDSENGDRWRQFLDSEGLAAQISRGANADKAEVGRILEIYRRDTPGLDHWQFVQVRQAIENWQQQLPKGIDELSEIAVNRQGAFSPVVTAEVSRTAEALNSAIRQLGSFLTGGDQENAEKWKQFLQWDSLKSEVQTASRPDFGKLQQALNAFYGPHVGLELGQFTAVRAALRDYMNAALFRYQPPTQESFTERLEELSARIREYDQSNKAEDAIVIGRTLGWLDSGDQLDEFVDGFRARYWQPNLYGHVSAKLIGIGIAEDVNQYQDISEVILGTALYGRAHTQGQIGVRLVPNTERACFDIEMTGFAWSDNVGYNGPVTLQTTGNTQIYSRKRVYLDALGLYADPAVASCSTSSQINSISARSKLVRKIAWKRAGQTKTQSEQIASYRAQLRVAGQMNGRAAGPLQESNERYQEKVRKPLVRFDAFPRQVSFRTDNDDLHVQITHATPYQIAAPVGPPPLEGRNDLAVTLHESIVANFAESLIGGRTITDEQLVKMLSDAGAEIPQELEIGPDNDPWSISFSPVQPIRAEFKDGQVRVGIRGRRFTRGEQVIRENIEISATYSLRRGGGGIRLSREGDVEVEYLGLDSLSIAQVAMKTFLRKKFDAVFEPDIASDGLVLPGQWEKAGALTLAELSAMNHWLVLGWQAPDDSMRTARTN